MIEDRGLWDYISLKWDFRAHLFGSQPVKEVKDHLIELEGEQFNMSLKNCSLRMTQNYY